MNSQQLAIQFFLMIGVILALCKVAGKIARRVGQPQVVAEMAAGILLGPSVLGALAPGVSAALFPAPAMGTLYAVAQLGLAAYMFIVGLEFCMDIAGKYFRAAMAVSIAGMAAPFAAGAALGWFFFSQKSMFPGATSRFEAVIFLGAAMCITAFPMLARIIHFKNLAGTRMGTISLGAGAINDAAAWCLLALVLASFDGNPARAVVTIGMGLGYVALVLLVLRPALAWWYRNENGALSEGGLITALLCMAFGAWFTDLIQLHAVFGAFIMGIAMPRKIAQPLIAAIQPLTVALLLPLFFTYSGLNTSIGLLNSPALWGMAAVIFIAAMLGKGGACALAARASGLPANESLGIGALMNARGLMELIIINIGLSRGIISQAMFAALVIMAIATTLIASPVFDYLTPKKSSDR